MISEASLRARLVDVEPKLDHLPPKRAVVYIAFGGPRSLEDVRPFLLNLFSDRRIIPVKLRCIRRLIARIIVWKRLENSKGNYAEIGGRSPQWAEIETMKVEMRKRLAPQQIDFHVACAWPADSVLTTLDELLAGGYDEALFISSFPQYSRCTLGAALDLVENAVSKRPAAASIEWRLVADHACDGWWVKSFASSFRALWDTSASKWQIAPSTLPEAISAKHTAVLLSFHGLPVSFIKKGDPYVARCETFVGKLAAELGCEVQHCYQSRADNRRWMQPSCADRRPNSRPPCPAAAHPEGYLKAARSLAQADDQDQGACGRGDGHTAHRHAVVHGRAHREHARDRHRAQARP